MAWPNLQTGKEFTVSFTVTSTLTYSLLYDSNNLVDPTRPTVKYPLDVKSVDNNL